MPALLVFVLVIAWSGYWLWLHGKVQKLFDEQSTSLAARGLTLACGEADWGGYPFRIEFTCSDPKFADRRSGLIAGAEAKSLFVIMQAYDFRKVAALLDGPTTIVLRDAEPLTIAHERVLASFQRVSAADQRLSIEVPALRIGENASAVTASFHFRARDESILDIAASGEGIAFTVENARFAIDSAALEADMPLSAIADQEILRGLAASGGTVNITRASLSKGELTISGSGALTITPQGLLDGRIATVISDLNLFITELQHALPLSEREIGELRALGGVLAGTTGGRSVPVDLRFQNGDIYWSAFKIGTM
ncbi:MAG: DUF2125 domain-containing protein, partial [Rhizobiales bacterium]|nr:DUF2125 domain-containing protein [Hyphomicrobiales bacterium]